MKGKKKVKENSTDCSPSMALFYFFKVGASHTCPKATETAASPIVPGAGLIMALTCRLEGDT